MIRSIATVSFGGNLKDKIYAASAAGFDALELTESVLAYSEMSPNEIRSLLDETGLSVSVFHSLTDVEGMLPERFEKLLARFDSKFELMASLGATLLLVPSNTSAETIDDETLFVDQLSALADKAAAHGMRVGYEPVATGHRISSYSAGWRIVEKAAHEHLGLILDSFEVLAAGHDPAAIADIPGDRILHVQLADAHAAPVDIETLGRHFRCFPGVGSLDVAGFAKCVAESGFNGSYSLEVLNDDLRSTPVRTVAMDGYRSLTFIEESLYRAGSQCARSTFEKSEPPPAQDRKEIRFVEFAVDPNSKRELSACLRTMGFYHAGRHRTKEVDLYRHGDVMIILNSGTDSFSYYYHHLHGVSACAIGLDVSNREAMLGRAKLYRYKTYDEPAGYEEYRMPAIRTPDGSLFHLVDDHYQAATDFEIEDADSPECEFVTRLDHVGRVVPPDQFDTWVLFYRTLLGLQADASLDLPDPHGIIHSQALHDSNNRLRLPLAYSESPRTVVARSLSVFGGAGINQIAFETDDIFAAVEALRRNGARILTIPQNYYRELEENKGVDPELVRRIHSASILYDQDESGGHFFHVYTDVFKSRFFFEFVQRVDGYDGYGESNAPVRMAAQARPH